MYFESLCLQKVLAEYPFSSANETYGCSKWTLVNDSDTYHNVHIVKKAILMQEEAILEEPAAFPGHN